LQPSTPTVIYPLSLHDALPILSSIRELGKEFAERNPRLAPFLAVEGQDPDVERLLEGFAFLTGRLRQKLDDELPELTHSLMALRSEEHTSELHSRENLVCRLLL